MSVFFNKWLNQPEGVGLEAKAPPPQVYWGHGLWIPVRVVSLQKPYVGSSDLCEYCCAQCCTTRSTAWYRRQYYWFSSSTLSHVACWCFCQYSVWPPGGAATVFACRAESFQVSGRFAAAVARSATSWIANLQEQENQCYNNSQWKNIKKLGGSLLLLVVRGEQKTPRVVIHVVVHKGAAVSLFQGWKNSRKMVKFRLQHWFVLLCFSQSGKNYSHVTFINSIEAFMDVYKTL